MLPLIIPFTAALLLLLRRENDAWQRGVSGAGIVAMFAASFHLLRTVMANGVAVAYLGDWPAPFGIVMAADVLGALMTLVTAAVGLGCVLFAFFDIERARMRGAFYSLFFFLLFGVNGAFLTGDIFNPVSYTHLTLPTNREV